MGRRARQYLLTSGHAPDALDVRVAARLHARQPPADLDAISHGRANSADDAGRFRSRLTR